jgi:hypothetical protein
MTIGSSTSGLECSFAGGCKYEVQAMGLSQSLKVKDTNYLTVCGQRCQFLAADSTASSAWCSLPPVSTTYSNENFAIAEMSEDLKAPITFGTNGFAEAAFDNNNLNNAGDDSVSCNIGVQFKDGHVGMISQVRYFLKEHDPTKFINITTFQGSMDGVSYTDLFQADENVHEGWNYFNWEDAAAYPKYQFYRFSGSESGSCKINEIKFIGVETIDDDQTSKVCQV